MLDKMYDVTFATDGEIAIKQAKKNIPVVFLTGVADREHITAVLELKPEGYLLKPIEQQRLLDTIEKVLTGTL